MNSLQACDHGEYFGSLSRLELALVADVPLSWVFWPAEPASPLLDSLWTPVGFDPDTALLSLTTTRPPRGVRTAVELSFNLAPDRASLEAWLADRLHRDFVARCTPASDGLRRLLLPLRLERKYTLAGSPQEASGSGFRLFSVGAAKVFYDAPTTAPAQNLGDFNTEFNPEFN